MFTIVIINMFVIVMSLVGETEMTTCVIILKRLWKGGKANFWNILEPSITNRGYLIDLKSELNTRD